MTSDSHRSRFKVGVYQRLRLGGAINCVCLLQCSHEKNGQTKIIMSTKLKKEEFFMLRLPSAQASRVNHAIQQRTLGDSLEIELGSSYHPHPRNRCPCANLTQEQGGMGNATCMWKANGSRAR